MATPILEKISKDLAYKLQDPVSTGTANGVRLSASERLNYILRAYRRLLRVVTLLYPDLIQGLFTNYYSTTSGSTTTTGTISFSNSELFDLYCKLPASAEYSRATYVSPEDFLDIKMGINKFYTPDLSNSLFFWTNINDVISVLPAVTLNYQINYRKDIAALVTSGGYGGATDIDVPTEHTDLILSFACAEAYLDLNELNLVNAYKQDANEQLSILASKTQKKESADEV